MNFDDKPGKLFEVIIGSATAIITVVLALLVVLLIYNGKLAVVDFVVCGIFLTLTLWFGVISYRLIFSRAKENGALFSAFALKFWCFVFGVSSIILFVVGLLEQDVVSMVSAPIMLSGCLFGWQLALKRQAKNGT